MLIKIIIVLMLLLILASLFSALFFLIKRDVNKKNTVKALTLRISLSIGLFLLLLLGYWLGVIGH